MRVAGANRQAFAKIMQTHPQRDHIGEKEPRHLESIPSLLPLFQRDQSHKAEEQAAEKDHPRSRILRGGQLHSLMHEVEKEIDKDSRCGTGQKSFPGAIQYFDR